MEMTMLSDRQLMAGIEAFQDKCEEDEHTDTGEAHELLQLIKKELYRRHDAKVAYQEEFRPKVKPLLDFTSNLGKHGDDNG